MAQEPSYPEDAPVGGPAESEASRAAAAAKAAKASGSRKRLITGAAIGIGSAALVAALLYANRARRSERS